MRVDETSFHRRPEYMGNAVLDVLHPKYGLNPNALSDDDVDALLVQWVIDG